jgi:N-acetylneuraminic acid mutarotase
MKKQTIKIISCLTFFTTSFYAQAQYVWTQMAGFPGAARSNASCFSIGHYGYVGCGQGSSFYSDWWRWDQNTNSWTQIASYPGAGQNGCTYFVIAGKAYVGLGTNGSVQTDLWSYDTATNSWSQMASFPGAARYGAYSFVIGSNAYMCGGNPGGPPYYTDCWKYNSVNNT